MSQDRFYARYRLRTASDATGARARELALEQSVEMPIEAVGDGRIRSRIAGKVVDIEPSPGRPGQFDARIALATESVGAEPGQLLNMAFGNASLQPDVELVDLELPDALLDAMPGPRYGIAGWRRSAAGLPPGSGEKEKTRDGTEAPERPLSCTALKPLGLDARALAELAYLFARAGIDVIKDDHGIADQDSAPFAERVPWVQQAVERANRDKRADGGALAGHHSIYAPCLNGGPARIVRQLGIVRREGVGAVLCCPMIVGVPVFTDLVRAEAGVPVLAHPALGGLRMAPALLLGRLFRLFGADAVIFPNHGGRFAFSPDECRGIVQRAREPLGTHRAALPVPAGGMQVRRIEEIIGMYGRDTMLLIGGDLLRAGDALAARAAEFVRRLAQVTGGRADDTAGSLATGTPARPRSSTGTIDV